MKLSYRNYCNRSWGHKNNKKNDINKQMLKYFLKG